MADDDRYDLVVIGGGPAGYAGAIRAGQLGKKVACVEMERAGGTCLNWGCIPSKALLKSAELYTAVKDGGDFGFTVSKPKVDWEKLMGRSRSVADKMAGGVEFLFKKNKVDYFRGKGRISVPGMVEIAEGKDTGTILTAANTLIATGCRARRIPDIEVDGERVMTSREALVMKKMPKSIIIVGAGAIGVEFAYFLNAFGCEVTLVEMLDDIVPIEDIDVSKALTRSFRKQGMTIHTGTKLENIEVQKTQIKAELAKGDEREKITAESLLLSIGVVPNLDGLMSSKVKLLTDEKGYAVVDDRYMTNMQNVFAAGDIIGPPWLAHVATWEALQAVNGMFGHSTPQRIREFPGCTYCQPQVASVGLTEQACKEKGLEYKVGKFPFTASGKAVAANESEGFVKLITDTRYGEILGAHIIGHGATELIAEYALAMKVEATAEEIHATIHAHPTLSEALMEAAADSMGVAIHI